MMCVCVSVFRHRTKQTVPEYTQREVNHMACLDKKCNNVLAFKLCIALTFVRNPTGIKDNVAGFLMGMETDVRGCKR